LLQRIRPVFRALWPYSVLAFATLFYGIVVLIASLLARAR
jgi:hypothetical protein